MPPIHPSQLDGPANPIKTPYGTSASGAMREAISTKIDTTLVPYELVVAAAIGFNYGAEKYAYRNFESGFTIAQLCGSIERHNKSLMDGEIIDRKSGLPHFALLASSVAMLCHNIMQGRLLPTDVPPKVGMDISDIAEHAQHVLNARG